MGYRIARLQRPDGSQVHPIVYHVRLMVGLDTIVEKPDSVVWPRIEKAYQALMIRVLTGKVFMVSVSGIHQLEYQGVLKITASSDAQAAMQAIRAKTKV